MSLAPGSPDQPKAICAKSYDREFAPWGEHYHLDNWFGVSQAFRDARFSADAIIDVDTGANDFGQVALVWKADGKRLKIFIREQVNSASDLPQGCRLFSEP